MRVKLAPLLCGIFSCKWSLLGFVFATLHLLPYQHAHAQTTSETSNPDFFRCGGPLEENIWRAWDEQAIGWVNSQLIESRLKGKGDSYALYDVEILFHNLLAMAQRCRRDDRQLQMASIANVAYAALDVAPEGRKGRAWVCRGGSVCNSTNKLVNTEVMLTSVQFLAFATSVAQGMNSQVHTDFSRNFVDQTIAVVSEHLLRWGSVKERVTIHKRIQARPEDVKDGSSALFLTDKELWQVSIYADLAGLLQKKGLGDGKFNFSSDELNLLKESFSLLLRLINSRITINQAKVDDTTIVDSADLDVGYWRLYSTNKFASYSGAQKPVTCIPDKDISGKFKIVSNLDGGLVSVVDNIGWDISHARRLVHFFDAVDRNRTAITRVFDIPEAEVPSRKVFEAFARQLLQKVWNQDSQRPLFSNYFSGANGWYRVAYDNGTGQCVEGSPPYGLSDSFPTGGYVTWAAYLPDLQILGENLYKLSKSSLKADHDFLSKYYPSLVERPRKTTGLLAELMFWPSLIQK